MCNDMEHYKTKYRFPEIPGRKEKNNISGNTFPLNVNVTRTYSKFCNRQLPTINFYSAIPQYNKLFKHMMRFVKY